MENIIADALEISFSEQCTRFCWAEEALGIPCTARTTSKERIPLARQPRAAEPHPLLCTHMLMLHFVAVQKAQQLITVNYNLGFPLNTPEKADLKIHWQEHSSHSISGSPPEWGVRAVREEKEREGKTIKTWTWFWENAHYLSDTKQDKTMELIKISIYHYLNKIWSITQGA